MVITKDVHSCSELMKTLAEPNEKLSLGYSVENEQS
jgi:hypothetical protein